MNTKSLEKIFRIIFIFAFLVGTVWMPGKIVEAQDPAYDPTFTVWLNQNKVDGYGWPESEQVTLTVGDPASPVMQVTETVGNVEDLGSQGIRFQFGDEFQLLNGQTITLQDEFGVYIRTHIITDLIVTSISASANIVTGTAATGSTVNISNKWDNQIWRNEIATPEWTADFNVAGDEPGEEIADIQPGEEYHVCQPAQDGSTCWHLPVTNPGIGVRANDDRVEGWQWPLGATVNITVDDPGTQGVDFTGAADVYEASWNPGEYRFDLNLNGVIDIQPNFEVTANLGIETKSHIVTPLAFTDINVDDNTVTGTAAPNSNVDVWTCDNDNCYNIPTVTADGSGIWVANFTGVYDIVPGTWIDSSQSDEDGDQTMYGENVPNPRIEVSYEHDWIQISDFTPGGEVTYTIYDHEGGHALFGPVTGPVDSHGNGWISSNLFHTDLVPGNYITAVNEATGEEKAILIQTLNLDYVGVDDDRAYGTTVPNATIEVNISEMHNSGFNLTTVADNSGYWEVDLAAEGHPIDSYRHASINLYDAEGDNIVAQPPRVHAQMSTDNFGVDNFSKNADVTLTLYNSPGGSVLYGPVTLRTEGSGNAWVNLWGTGIDLVPGHYIIAYDHMLDFTKSLEVEPFDIVELNATDDYVAGTAAMGEWVELHVESLFSNWGLDAFTDEYGQWFRDYGQENYDITEQMWANGWAIDDQANWSEDHTTGSPGLEASPAEDWISGFNFSPDRQVRLRIYVTEGGSLLADELVNAWGNTQFFADYWTHEVDLQAGMFILAEDLETGKSAELTLVPLTFDGLDYDTNYGWGKADDGTEVVVRANHLFDSCEISTIADIAGNWSVDFSTCGVVIDSNWDVRAMVFDAEFDATIANAPQPPEFSASLSDDWVNGNNWTPNNTVTINMFEYEGGPAIGSPFVWDTDNYGSFHADLRNRGVDLLPGYYITVTDTQSGVVKTLTLPNLTIDYMDVENDLAGGQAPPDTRLSLDFNNQLESIQFDMFSELDGTWEADFKLYDFDLTPGSSGSVRISDDDGDAAQVDGYVPNPTFGARPDEERVEGWQWTLGETVTVSIDDPATTGVDPDFSDQAIVRLADWNPNETWFDLNFNGQYDLKPGDLVTVTDSNTTKTHVVTTLAITNIDVDNDIISGTTNTAGSVDIWICDDNGCVNRNEPVAQNGSWSANFAVPGNENWENGTYDINYGTGGDSGQWDNDGDGTMVGWYAFSYTLHVVPSHPEVHGHDWRWGSNITLIIDDDIDPDNGTLYTRTKNADDDPWCGYPCFDLAGLFDLQAGQYVTMTDGVVTKTVRVSSLQILSVDIENETISGVADAGSDVMVNIGTQDGKARHVVAEADGTWTVDFSIFGDEDFEQFTTDITYGDNGRAIQLNPDGTDDGTLEYWGVDWIAPDWIPLVVAHPYTPDLNHPGYAYEDWTILNLLLEPLFRTTDQGELVPAAATDYSLSTDGLIYTITLRDDMFWTDGEPVTAQHYVDGFLRLIHPDTATDYGSLLYDIAGAESYGAGGTNDPNDVGMTALDDHTLQIVLREPSVHLPIILGNAGMTPVRLDLIDQYGDAWVDPANFVGNGPYQLVEMDRGHIIVERNPDYYDTTVAVLSPIAFDIIEDPAEQVNAYLRDEVDVVPGAPNDVISDPNLADELVRSPRPGVIYIGLNLAESPTDLQLVRQALASAIDRRALLDDVLGVPWLETATGVIPPDLPGYQGEAVGYVYNLDTAQELLAQAGYPGGVGLPTIQIFGPPNHQALIEFIADQWRTNLGVSVEIDYNSNYVSYLRECRGYPDSCHYNAYRLGWLVDYFDAFNILNDLFHPESNNMFTNWDNARYRELMDLIRAEQDPDQRIAYLQEAEQILVGGDAAIIPLYYLERFSLVKPRFTTVFGLVPYYELWSLVSMNHPPSDVVITAPTDPLPINELINVLVEFSDPDENDDHTVLIEWGDSTTTEIEVSGLSAEAAHQYTSADVYVITVTVTDPAGESAQATYQYIVIYDPEGGFVTGGGWIWSPEGAYAPDPSITGKATFGFVAKYKKGAGVPDGNTEFQFKVADLNFKSTAYDWLVIAGKKAMYKGTGTINGAGEYKFLLMAIDGDLQGGDGLDKFRIKIWDTATGEIVYDNQSGDSDSTDPTTVLGGGSIVIHTK